MKSLTIDQFKAAPFHTLSTEELVTILRWRNDSEVRKWMNRSDPISWQEHINFVRELAIRNDRLYFLVEEKNHPIGVVSLTSIDLSASTAELGLYRRPDEPGKKYGVKLLRVIERIAHSSGIGVLRLKVRRRNAAAIGLYAREGYQPAGSNDEYQFMEKEIQPRHETSE